jgi:hypothetical protein
MKFYQNIVTGEIIGVENMRELITHPTLASNNLGYNGYSYQVIYDMICPNHILGNGVDTFCITHSYLKQNYKRIKAEIAFNQYPNFKQYRHENIPQGTPEERLAVLRKQTF